MMMRLTLTDVVWGQIAISLLLLAGTVVGCIWVSARLFRANSLLAGKKLTFNEIVRALQG
jgi:ABC-2 type transport system permease protein